MAGELSSATVKIYTDWTYQEELTLSTSINTGTTQLGYTFDNGDEAGQANRVYAIKGAINPSSSTTLDLSSLTDFFNLSMAFDSIRVIYVELLSDSDCASILIGGAGVATPLTAPSLSLLGSGSLGAGTYKVAYSFENAQGETRISPVQSIVVAGSQDIRVAAITLPSGATTINYYMSLVANANALAYHGSDTGAAYDIDALPLTAGDAIPSSNTAMTGVSTLFGGSEHSLRVYRGGCVCLTSPDNTAGYALDSTFKKIKIANEDSTYIAHYVITLIGFEDV